MTPEPDMDLDDTDASDWSLTKKLRVEDPEQFHTLVRMHLSFVLDLNTDEADSSTEEKTKFRPLKWSFTSFSKKLKNSKSLVEEESVVPLTQDILSQIYQLIDFLSLEENVTQEGIFRKSGSTSRQQELKSLLGQGNILELTTEQFSVHDCASVLKCYLSDLPEPVLLELYYPAYCQIADSESSTTRLLRSIQLLLLLLPLDSYNLFHKLIHLLHLTASHAGTNRMSSNNLATLFTPHLLCPRKLSPETLHTSAAVLSKILVFMIDNEAEIFLVPDTLATDVKAYWAKKERKLKSPVKDPVNDSIMDSSAVNTVFTFVDREKTAQENTENATEAALAQLYAYIQALPESSKKRRLVKQFNKENGHGTPAVVARLTPAPHHPTGKHFGDSIKKHIFSKGLRNKLNNQATSKVKTKLPLDNMGPRSTGDLIPPTLRQTPTTSLPRPMPDLTRLYTKDPWAESSDDEDLGSPFFATPSHRLVVSRRPGVPGQWSNSPVHSSSSVSPITMSAQKMSRAMQETMLTPRSRKPVVALSGTNLCTLATFQSPHPLPGTTDDLLTATVDLSLTQDSLSDSMIKTLEEGDERIFPPDTPRNLTKRNPSDENHSDLRIEGYTDITDGVELKEPKWISQTQRDNSTSTRDKEVDMDVNQEGEKVEPYTSLQEPWDGGVSSSKLKGVTSSSSMEIESSVDDTPPFVLSRAKKSTTNLFSRLTSAADLGSENQNQSKKFSGTCLAARYQNPLHVRDNFEISNQISESLLKKENSSAGLCYDNRKTDVLLQKENSLGGLSLGSGKSDSDETPPSRKRSSQNNNNDEGEIKRCLRESDVTFPLSETAL